MFLFFEKHILKTKSCPLCNLRFSEKKVVFWSIPINYRLTEAFRYLKIKCYCPFRNAKVCDKCLLSGHETCLLWCHWSCFGLQKQHLFTRSNALLVLDFTGFGPPFPLCQNTFRQGNLPNGQCHSLTTMPFRGCTKKASSGSISIFKCPLLELCGGGAPPYFAKNKGNDLNET